MSEPGSNQANTLLTALSAGIISLSAPEHLVDEIANSLRKRVAQGVLGTDDACAALDDIAALELDFASGTKRWFRTLRAATGWQVTTYDAVYVLLALDLDVELITADTRLADATAAESLPVRLLGT